MKGYTTWAAIGATALIGAGAVVLPALGSTDSTTHTLRFTAITQKSATFGKNSFGQDEIDRNKDGKIIGFDVINGTYDPMTNTAKGRVALSIRGGFIYGSLKFSDGPVTTGRVTGGTGKFKGVTGTIHGRSLDKSGHRTAVVIHYQ